MKLNLPISKVSTWSHVEKEVVKTLNQFTTEFTRQLDFHLKSYNKLRRTAFKQEAKGQSEIQTRYKKSFNADKFESESTKKNLLNHMAEEEFEFW